MRADELEPGDRVEFGAGDVEEGPEHALPLVPGILMASYEATGPIAVTSFTLSTVIAVADAYNVCGTPSAT